MTLPSARGNTATKQAARQAHGLGSEAQAGLMSSETPLKTNRSSRSTLTLALERKRAPSGRHNPGKAGVSQPGATHRIRALLVLGNHLPQRRRRAQEIHREIPPRCRSSPARSGPTARKRCSGLSLARTTRATVGSRREAAAVNRNAVRRLKSKTPSPGCSPRRPRCTGSTSPASRSRRQTREARCPAHQPPCRPHQTTCRCVSCGARARTLSPFTSS